MQAEAADRELIGQPSPTAPRNNPLLNRNKKTEKDHGCMFDPRAVSEETLEGIRTATEGGAPLDMALVLRKLLALGFTSCRYYDVALNAPSPEPVLILTAAVGDTPDNLGYRIAYRDSTLAQAPNPRRAAFGASDPIASAPKFVKDLGLEGRDWVDVPILYGDRLIGLIAADWKHTDQPKLTAQDVLLLDFLALRIASSMLAQPVPDRIRQLRPSAMFAAPGVDICSLLQDACKEICRSLSAGAVAIFEYHWHSNSIRRIAEEVHLGNQVRLSDFPEVYSPSKCSLTWHAWENEQVHHLADFAAFRELHPELIDAPCVHRHETLLGGIVSILFSTVGHKEHGYLIRVINRVDAPRLPFVTRHAELLNVMSARLSALVDQAAVDSRFRRLEKTARTLCGKQAASPRDVLQAILEALEDEGISNYAVFSRARSGTQSFGFIERAGAMLKHWDYSHHQRTETDNDRFFSRCSHFERPKIVDVRSFQEHSDRDHFLGFLYQEGVEWLVVCPFAGFDVSGLIACPLVTERVSGEIARTRIPPALGAQREGILSTYATMLGSALESITSSLTTDAAAISWATSATK